MRFAIRDVLGWCPALAGVAAAALLPFTEAAAGGALIPYPIRTVEFANGLRLVLVEMPTPGVVHYQTVVRAGSRNEVEPGRSGYAHFFEHMMFRGTRRFPEERYRTILDMLGADHNASTGMDQTSYHLTLPSSGIAEVIEMEADRFRDLQYSVEQFRKEAGAVLGEFAISRADPSSLLEEKLLSLAFSRHPYGHTVIGLEDDVRSMPEGYDYSLRFYDHYYKPESCVILVAGDFDPDEVERAVGVAYADWPRGGFVPEIKQEPPLEGPIRDELIWEGPTRPILEIAFRTPAYGEATPVTAALEMVREVFFGATSDLYRDLVDQRRLAESVSASAERARDPYLVRVTARIRDAADLEEVERTIFETLAEAGTRPIGRERIESAKRRMLASLALSLETPGGVGWRLSEFLSLTGDPHSLERHHHNIVALTSEDLRAAAATYLVRSRSIRLTLTGRGTGR